MRLLCLLFRSGWNSKTLRERLSVNTGCTAGGSIAVLTRAPAVRSPKCPRVITVPLAVIYDHTASVFGRFLTLAYTADPSADHSLPSVWSYWTRSVYRDDASF